MVDVLKGILFAQDWKAVKATTVITTVKSLGAKRGASVNLVDMIGFTTIHCNYNARPEIIPLAEL